MKKKKNEKKQDARKQDNTLKPEETTEPEEAVKPEETEKPEEPEGMSEAEFHGYVSAYAPLVLSLAGKYKGRGAEFEELVQEGNAALCTLIPRCPDRKKLGTYLKRHLPGYVRDAAERLRWRYDDENFRYLDVSLDELTEWRYDAGAERFVERSLEPLAPAVGAYIDFDVYEILRRILDDEEFWIVWWLMNGWTQREAAHLFGVSQPALVKRLKKIRRKLLPYLPMIIVAAEQPTTAGQPETCREPVALAA